MPPNDLPERIRSGEQSAFEEFRLLYSANFYRYFRRHNVTDADAIELAGNCVVDISLKVAPHFPIDHTSFHAWVCTLRNRALQNWRRCHQLHTIELNPNVTPAPGPFVEAAPNPLIAGMAAALVRLDSLDQEIVALRYGGLETPTFPEIAAELQSRWQTHFDPNSIRQRHARALGKLEVMLTENPDVAKLLVRTLKPVASGRT